MTSTQAAERQADRENLIRELTKALGIALAGWSEWYDDCRGRDIARDSEEFVQCRAILAKAKEQGYA